MGPRYKDNEGQGHWEGGYSGEVKGYEHEEIEDEGNAIDETHECSELVYEKCELKELEQMANEQGHALEHHNSGTQQTNRYRHNDNDNAHTQSTPTYIPPPLSPSPLAPIPLMCDSSHSNQWCHMTTSKSCESAFNNEDEAFKHEELECMYAKWGHEPPAAPYNMHDSTINSTNMYTTAPPSPSPPLTQSGIYISLDTLHCNYHNEIPSVITYMQELQGCTKDCLYKHAEWKADQ